MEIKEGELERARAVPPGRRLEVVRVRFNTNKAALQCVRYVCSGAATHKGIEYDASFGATGHNRRLDKFRGKDCKVSFRIGLGGDRPHCAFVALIRNGSESVLIARAVLAVKFSL